MRSPLRRQSGRQRRSPLATLCDSSHNYRYGARRQGKEPQPKKLYWVGSSRRDLISLPRDVYRKLGQGLGLVQLGGMPSDAKALQGFGGASMLELREHDRAGTYRAVYTVRFAETVYVLHVFQKKSKKGIATDQKDIELIRARLKEAEAHYASYGTSRGE